MIWERSSRSWFLLTASMAIFVLMVATRLAAAQLGSVAVAMSASVRGSGGYN